MNISNIKIIIEKSENNNENIDDMDDVCNFSGINNISYTNRQEVEHKNDLFDENFDDFFQIALSSKPIFHKINLTPNIKILIKQSQNIILIKIVKKKKELI